MSETVSKKLSYALKSGWTAAVRRGNDVVHLPKFMPPRWIEDGRLDESRLRLLEASGWHLDKLADGQNYLFPDDELATYALGWASDDYARIFPNRADGIARAKGGRLYDLTDAILYSDALSVETTLPSGLKLFFRRLPDGWDAAKSVAKNIETALNGGWLMVKLITENDLFLLPPECLEDGAKITLGDSKVGIGTLFALKREGFISLRGKFGKKSGALLGLTLPPRASRGGEWKLEEMLGDQKTRWGGADRKVSGLRIVSEREAAGLHANFFRLVFARDGMNWRLISSSDYKGDYLQKLIEGMAAHDSERQVPPASAPAATRTATDYMPAAGWGEPLANSMTYPSIPSFLGAAPVAGVSIASGIFGGIAFGRLFIF